MFICCLFVGPIGIVLVAMVPVLFLMFLDRTLRQVAPRNRQIEPDAVWFNLLPGSHLYWSFFTVQRLANSLEREFTDRGIDWPGSPSETGLLAGLWCASFNVLAAATGVLTFVIASASGTKPDDAFAYAVMMQFVTLLPPAICLIVYGVQVASLAARLKDTHTKIDDTWHDEDEFPSSPNGATANSQGRKPLVVMPHRTSPNGAAETQPLQSTSSLFRMSELAATRYGQAVHGKSEDTSCETLVSGRVAGALAET